MSCSAAYVLYEPPYAALSPHIVQLLVQRGVGRNGWAVMLALCMGLHENRMFDRKSAQRIAELTGLTEKQVSRGMAELKEQGIIAPIVRKSKGGSFSIDRPCFGHVATYCFTKDAWEQIADGFKSDQSGC